MMFCLRKVNLIFLNEYIDLFMICVCCV